MKIVVEGTPYEWDETELTIGDFRTIKQCTGMAPVPFFQAAKDGDPDAVQALIFLVKRKAGENVNYADLGNIRYSKFSAMSDEAGSEGQAEETAPAGDPSVTWPPDGTSSTSE